MTQDVQALTRRRIGPNAVFVGSVLGFLSVQKLLADSPTALHWWTDLAWTLAAFYATLRVFERSREGVSPLGRAWAFIGGGCLAWTLGMLVWAYQELIAGEVTPFPGPADIGFLLFAPLVAIGLLLYRGRGHGVPFTLLEFSQLGIFVCCVMIVHVLLFAERIAEHDYSGLYVATAIAYPVTHMSIMVQALANLWASPPGPERRPLTYLTAGIAVLSLVNSFYAFALLGSEYAVGHYMDAGWIIAFLLMARAADEARKSASTGVARADRRALVGRLELLRALRVASLLPVLALLATAAVVFAYRHQLDAGLIEDLTPAVFLLIAFLGLREWASQNVREHLDRGMRESELRFRRFFDASPAMIGVTRLSDGRFVDVNEAFEEVSGWAQNEVLGRTAAELGLWPEAGDRETILSRSRSKQESDRAVELHMQTRSGSIRDLMASIEVLSVGGEDCLFVVATDVTDRRQTQAEMRKLSRALQQTAEAIMITDAEGIIEYVNPAFETITGYGAKELYGHPTEMLQSSARDEQYYADLWRSVRSGQIFADVFTNRRKDGSLYHEERTITPLKNERGEITHFISTGRDISERIQTQARLEHLAHHDVLTDLPNRALLLDRLGQALSRARWHQRLVAVMFVDVDRFKNINDTLGHEAGDQVLVQIGQHLIHALRERDTVARFGGDEFVVLLDDVADIGDVSHLAEKLLHVLQAPLPLNGNALHVTASIGISLFPSDGDNASTLLKNADAAMYRAKELGRNGYQFYSAEMTARVSERLTLENALRQAYEARQFRLHYQPQIDVDSGRVHGVEALLRWRDEGLGEVSPAEFVPVLEEIGLIVPVGAWVLDEACRQLAQWHSEGYRELRLSVNLSAHQLRRSDVPSLVREVLDRYSIAPGQLELEVTESTLMHHGEHTEQSLEALAALGVRVAIDDFGTGYSSLSYLRRFSIDTLKIDRSFVRELPDDEDGAAIVRAIAGLAETLHLQLVAEGVETESQRDFLAGIGCRIVQGFLYCPAVPPGELRLP